jgi:hypothetical protein
MQASSDGWTSSSSTLPDGQKHGLDGSVIVREDAAVARIFAHDHVQ